MIPLRRKKKKNFIKYKCNKCGFETEIPYDLIDVTLIINNLYTDKIKNQFVEELKKIIKNMEF